MKFKTLMTICAVSSLVMLSACGKTAELPAAEISEPVTEENEPATEEDESATEEDEPAAEENEPATEEDDEDDVQEDAEESDTSKREEYTKEYDSPEDVLYVYREAQEGRYSQKQMEELIDYGEALIDYGWPYASSEEIRYLYYDVDSDGKDELFLTYRDRIVDIYGNYGDKLRHAFSVYSENVTLYEGGMISVYTPDTAEYPGTMWYRYDTELGDYLGAFEESMGEYYTFCSYELEGEVRKEVEDSYRKYGFYPVWLGEWDDQITKELYESLIPKTKKVKLPQGEKLSDIVLPDDYKASFEPNDKPIVNRIKEVKLSDSTQYEANIFLSNFVEQVSNQGQEYTFGKDSDMEDLLRFVFRYGELNSGNDFDIDESGPSLTLDQVNAVLDRFFGITLTEDQAEKFDKDKNNCYRNGVFHVSLGYGDTLMDVAIVRQINELDDGTYELLFDIYSPSLDEYETGEKDVNDLYHLSASKAMVYAGIYRQTSGSATVKPYKYKNRNTYQLIRMDVAR